MKHLAYWIYSDPKLQTGVTESKLIEKATEYLHHRLFEDLDLSRKTARDFIEFCRGRAWVFTDTGSTADGELLYQFTHRTFLEYFTAAQLVRTHPRPSDLAPVLIPRIEKKEWDIVAQLAFQLQNNNVEGAADELLSLVINKAKAIPDPAQSALLSFAARCLEFMLPSRKTVREITEEALSFVIKTAVQQLPRHEQRNYTHSEVTRRAQTLIRDLFNVAVENRTTVADSMQQSLDEGLKSSKRSISIAAFDIAGYSSAVIEKPRPSDSEISELWASISSRLFRDNMPRIMDLAKQSPFVAKTLYINSGLPMVQLLEWHGLGEFFGFTRSIIFDTNYYPVLDLMIRGYHRYGTDVNLAAQIDAIGSYLLKKRPPWIHTRALGVFGRSRFGSWGPTWPDDPSPGLVFGIFLLLAVLLESGENRRTLSDSLRFIETSRSLTVRLVRELLISRYSPRVNVESVLANYQFSVEQKGLINMWAFRKISFVEGAKRSKLGK